MSSEEDYFMYVEESFPSRCFNMFETMNKNDQLRDVIITCGNTSVSAHRVVLAATVPFFYDKFTGNSTESKDEVVVEGVDPCALESLIQFVYTCEVKITKENVESLLKASSRLRLTCVKDACCQFLSNHIDHSNAIHLRELADSLNCVDLLEACDRHICENFDIIFKSDHFVNMSFSAFSEALSRDDLTILSEQHVFEAVLKWVRGSAHVRKDFLPGLLKFVRMPFLTPEYLIERAATEELIKTSFACRDIVDEAKNYHLLPRRSSVFSGFIMKPRKYRNVEDHGIFFFCYKEHLGVSVYYYNSDTDMWLKLVTVNSDEYQKFHRFAYYVAAQDSVYAVGHCYSQVFNVKTLEWKVHASLHKMPSCSQMVLADNKMYYFNGMFPSKMRCFDLQQNVWLTDICMKTNRHSVGASVLGEYIFVTGGAMEEWHEESNVSSVVEKYNCNTKLWTELSPMLSKRYGHRCTALNDKIYACGGCELEILNTAEVYDPQINEWNYIAPMRIPRISFSLVAYHGKLYAFDSPMKAGQSFSHDMDIYDSNNDEWRPGPSIYCHHESQTAVTGVASTVSAVAIPVT